MDEDPDDKDDSKRQDCENPKRVFVTKFPKILLQKVAKPQRKKEARSVQPPGQRTERDGVHKQPKDG